MRACVTGSASMLARLSLFPCQMMDRLISVTFSQQSLNIVAVALNMYTDLSSYWHPRGPKFLTKMYWYVWYKMVWVLCFDRIQIASLESF